MDLKLRVTTTSIRERKQCNASTLRVICRRYVGAAFSNTIAYIILLLFSDVFLLIYIDSFLFDSSFLKNPVEVIFSKALSWFRHL
jgi:hypothetical protein